MQSRTLPAVLVILALAAWGCDKSPGETDDTTVTDTVDMVDAPDTPDTAGDTPDEVLDAEDIPDAGDDCPDYVGESCTGNWDCQDCSYCNGVEVCEDFVCEPGIPIDCSDTHECTADSCDEVTEDCLHVLDNSLCDDGTACNGAEYCTEDEGCLDAPPIDCNDGIMCTLDSCEEPTGDCSNVVTDAVCDDGNPCTTDVCDTTADACENTLMDNDGDTFPPESCGGPDCDDDDPTRYPWAPESCTDGIDSNCNGLADVSDPVCCSGSGDTCDCPVDMTTGGVLTGTTAGMMNDYCGSCGASPCGFDGADVAFYLSIPTTSLVLWTFTGMTWNFYIHVHQGSCTGTETLCQTFPTGGTSLSAILDPGYYFLILDSPGMTSTGPYSINTETTPVVAVSGNDTCSTAVVAAPGTTYAGSIAGFTDDYTSWCSWWGGGADAVFEITLTTDTTVEITTNGTEFDSVLQIVDTSCTVTDLPCDDNGGSDGVSARIHSLLAAGTYYIIVDDVTWGAGGSNYIMTYETF